MLLLRLCFQGGVGREEGNPGVESVEEASDTSDITAYIPSIPPRKDIDKMLLGKGHAIDKDRKRNSSLKPAKISFELLLLMMMAMIRMMMLMLMLMLMLLLMMIKAEVERCIPLLL